MDYQCDYRCSVCQASGVRLWRQYQTMSDRVKLLCQTHAEENQREKLSPHSDTIGWLVPAVPVDDTFWGYTSVPQEGVNWWYSLHANVEAADRARLIGEHHD